MLEEVDMHVKWVAITLALPLFLSKFMIHEIAWLLVLSFRWISSKMFRSVDFWGLPNQLGYKFQ